MFKLMTKDYQYHYHLSFPFSSLYSELRLTIVKLGMDSFPKNEKLTAEVCSFIVNLIASEPLSGSWFRYQLVNILNSDPILLLVLVSDMKPNFNLNLSSNPKPE